VTDGAAVPGPFFLGYHEPGAEEEFQVFKHYGQALSYMETPEVDEGPTGCLTALEGRPCSELRNGM
jgi:hypothetical protein